MKKLYTVLMLFAIIIVVFGCTTKDTGNTDTSTGENTETSTDNKETLPPVITEKTKFSHLFDYYRINTFQYRISTNIEGVRNTLDTDYVVTPEVYSGRDAWLVTTSVATDTGIIKNKMWIDKMTHKCIGWESAIINGDQVTPQPGGCPLSGINSQNYGDGDLVNMGKEEVNVPAGVFNADRYELQGITFWTTPEVAVPLKIIYNDGSVKIVLMKYG